MKAFDLSFQRSTDERQIREPRSLRFIHEAEAAIQAGCGAYSMTAHDLVIVLGRAVPKSMVDMRDRGHVKDRNLQVPVNILSGNFLAGKWELFNRY